MADILERLINENSANPSELLADAIAEIERLRAVAGAVSGGPSLSDLRKTTGC